MPTNLLVSALSWTLASVGITLLASTSLTDHVDVVVAFVGLLLVLLGFWLRDWKAKIEVKVGALEKTGIDHTVAIAEVRGDVKDMRTDMARAANEVRDLAADVRRFHYWAYNAIGGLTSTVSTPPSMFAPGDRRVANNNPFAPPLVEEKEEKKP